MRRLAWQRPRASAVAAGGCFVAGIATVLSFNRWSGWYPLAGVGAFDRATVFDLLDQLTSNLLLPAGGLAIALFTGWALPAQWLIEELGLDRAGAAALRVSLRYLVPIGIVAATTAAMFT
jgi:NSS family neurotransmitter:Na+ symporter